MMNVSFVSLLFFGESAWGIFKRDFRTQGSVMMNKGIVLFLLGIHGGAHGVKTYFSCLSSFVFYFRLFDIYLDFRSVLGEKTERV